MSFPTPTTTYTPGEISEAERIFWRSESQMNVAVKSTETTAATAISDAATAQSTADSALSAANAAQSDVDALDLEAVKTSGSQTISNIKTFTSFIEYASIPAIPSGNQVPRMYDVVTEATRNDGSWTALTIMAGWTGNASARLDRWGYLEVIFSVTYQSPNSGFATLPLNFRPNYQFTSLLDVDRKLTILSNGIMLLSGSGGGGLESHYFRIKLNTPY